MQKRNICTGMSGIATYAKLEKCDKDYSFVRNCRQVQMCWCARNYVKLLVVHHVHPVLFQFEGLSVFSFCLFIYYQRIESVINLSWPRNSNFKASCSLVICVTQILKFCLFFNAKSQ